MSYTVMNYENTPSYENIVDICKIKAFVWVQLLAKKNLLKDVEFYRPGLIYIDTKKVFTFIEKVIFSINRNSIKLEFVYNGVSLFFNIELGAIEKKRPNTFEVNPKDFLYPSVLRFKVKPSEEKEDYLSAERTFCNIRALFFDTISIHSITLIDNIIYNSLNTKSVSKYTKQVFNPNSIDYSDITFTLFHHPELLPLSEIYGFIYNISSPVSLNSVEIRLKKPRAII